jgi:hypothetical protein
MELDEAGFRVLNKSSMYIVLFQRTEFHAAAVLYI